MSLSKKLMVVVSLFCFSGAFAKVGFNLGVKGGFASSAFWGLEVDDLEKSILATGSEKNGGFSGAVFGEMDILRKLSVQMELGYCQRGVEFVNSSSPNTILWDINYLEWSMLPEFRPFKKGVFQPAVYMGPSVNFLLSEKMAAIKNNEVAFDSTNSNDEVSPMDYGISMGIVPQFQFNRVFLFTDFRLYLGSKSLFKTQYDENDLPVSLQIFHKNSSVTLGVGINIKKATFKSDEDPAVAEVSSNK